MTLGTKPSLQSDLNISADPLPQDTRTVIRSVPDRLAHFFSGENGDEHRSSELIFHDPLLSGTVALSQKRVRRKAAGRARNRQAERIEAREAVSRDLAALASLVASWSG